MRKSNSMILNTVVGLLCGAVLANGTYAGEFRSILFRSVEPIYDESFDTDGPRGMPEQRKIRQENNGIW